MNTIIVVVVYSRTNSSTRLKKPTECSGNPISVSCITATLVIWDPREDEATEGRGAGVGLDSATSERENTRGPSDAIFADASILSGQKDSREERKRSNFS